MARPALVDRLLHSSEPSIRWKTRIGVLGEKEGSVTDRALRGKIRRSPRVAALLSRRSELVGYTTNRGVYDKWQGLHWVLVRLADIGYPRGDVGLHPARDRVLNVMLAPHHFLEFDADSQGGSYRGQGVPRVQGRYRRCGSTQGNALFAITELGIDDGRGASLVERLRHWQWPDGGWNCDREPSADTSSFYETLTPMLGLAAYARRHDSAEARRAARRASEVFLQRRMFRRRSDGQIIHPEFVRLHYPVYWHYDLLAGLKGMVAVGRIDDPRCRDALDELERKQLATGGWAAERKFYRVSPGRYAGGCDYVDWAARRPGG